MRELHGARADPLEESGNASAGTLKPGLLAAYQYDRAGSFALDQFDEMVVVRGPVEIIGPKTVAAVDKQLGIVQAPVPVAQLVHRRRLLVGDVHSLHGQQLAAAVRHEGRAAHHGNSELDAWNLGDGGGEPSKQLLGCARSPLRLFHRAANGADRTVEIDDEPFAQSLRFGSAQGQKPHLGFVRLADEHACLRASNVQTN